MRKAMVLAVILIMIFGVLGGCAKEQSSVGIIGGADGPTAVVVSPGCERQ
ncbi:MAG: sodium ion-translocating decarboxylase subunit beta [Clostridiales bacterium]|nr:sodium ion-translocating decarboxylase subunit beta [Clostridiales bacterium]